MTCPRCGNEATGRFCSTCGAALQGAACPRCGATLGAGARFCHACGSAAGAGGGAGSSGVPPWLPWTVAGALLIALLVVAIARTGPAGPVDGTEPAVPAQTGVPSAMRGGDISRMTPQQRADALYDRIMRLHEGGAADSVAFFKPMALAAYQMLGNLDRDALFHVGLIHAVSGTPETALAYADSIETGMPNHLFAKIVRWEAAEAAGDAALQRQAAAAFARAYEEERALSRPEYAAHPQMLDSYRAEMRGVTP